MRINDKNLKLLRQHVMIDSEISEEERQRSLDAIADVKAGLDDGRYVLSDRMSTIRDAAQKKQKSFRKKVKAKNRKMLRNATEDTRSIKSLDAFDEKFMYSTEEEIRRYADGMGITEVYQETKRFDEEWN
jgi:hypothetical protein